MKPQRWQQIKEVLDTAVALDPGERTPYLDRACAADPELRREVDSLLVSHERAGTKFLQIPAVDLLGRGKTDETPAPLAGRRVGVYQIAEEIGHGGMGEVYRATRADGQYEKEVAVKLVRGGYDTAFIVERFRHERQILASLDHPNIARLLDGGETEEGIPYLVMELIAGAPIDVYCDVHKLSITQRLQIFRQVCAAVQYAHQRLVIHRDIKPSNILVTEDGTPRLLDFGIAKLLSPTAALETTLARPMTPEYASPEQIRGEPITTATDVYSLGIVLYRLLTSRSPYPEATRTPLDVARVICEAEPMRPSAALLPKESWAKLRRQLAGDLDNIVLKALRKEPERRYATVEQFSEDIRRHLQGMAVTAAPDKLSYRLGKFVRRHKAGVAATGLVVVAVLGGVTATLREARIADANARRAEQRFNDVRRLANSLMFEVHDSIKDLPGSTPARKLLVTRALEYLDSLNQEAKGDTSLLRELAAAYERIGDVQGQPRQANLGDSAGAAESYRKALAIREALAAAEPGNMDLRRELTPNYSKLSDLLWTTGDPQGAMENSRKEMAAAEEVYRSDPNDPANRLLLASYRMDHGYKLAAIGGDREGGLENLRQGAAMLEQMSAENPGDLRVRRILGLSYSRAAGILEDEPNGRDQALAFYKKSIAIKEALLAADPNNADFRRMLAYDEYAMGGLLAKTDLNDALRHERAALFSFEELAGADPANMQLQQDRGRALGHIGQILTRMNEFPAALEQLRRSYDVLYKLPGTENPQSMVGYEVASDEFWMGKANVGLAASPTISSEQQSSFCQQAESWFQKCLPAWEQLRDHASAQFEGALRVEEIQRQRTKCDLLRRSKSKID